MKALRGTFLPQDGGSRELVRVGLSELLDNHAESLLPPDPVDRLG